MPGTQIVPQGSYIVSPAKEELLEAYLGTCVGVTLFDRKAHVGGLMHLLLAEPTGTDIPYQPETYASTGLPLFIQGLRDAGAANERLEGCIAGGALVGPVSEQDFSLDIGGRTTEVVQDILRREGINVTQVETGGFAGCRLTLNLSSWESTIEPLWRGTESGDAEFKTPTSAEIDQAIEKVRPIPQIALKIIRMIRGDDYEMEDIAHEVRQDQVISAGVIKLCNTAMIGLRSKIDSIDRALIVLGEKKLLQIVVSASVKTVFPDTPYGYSLCKGGMFQHALGTAMVAHELAVFTERSASDIAYTAGLLHDIGKIPLDQYMTSAAPYFYRCGQEKGIELCKLEKERFGASHTEAGRVLAEKWDLPENLNHVISYHHEPEKSQADRELGTLVYVADLLMSRFQVAHEIELLGAEQLKMRLERLGLTPQQFPVLIDRIPRTVFETSLMGI